MKALICLLFHNKSNKSRRMWSAIVPSTEKNCAHVTFVSLWHCKVCGREWTEINLRGDDIPVSTEEERLY
jgi:hypothetical protein